MTPPSYLGAHVSIAGGFDKCITRASEMGANCLMTFASSPRSLQYKEVDTGNYQKIGPHFFHAPYLVNLASANPDYLQAGINLLSFYQNLSSRIGGAGTIFHIGSSPQPDLNQVALAIIKTQQQSGDLVPIILENSAGQANSIGANLSEIEDLVNNLKSKIKNFGVCLDTQHLFASGITLESALDKFNEQIGLHHLKVIHLNDSKTDFGSHVDRHENLGSGKIGLESIKKFVNDPRLKNIPFILEVPGAGDGPQKRDIDTLKSLIDN